MSKLFFIDCSKAAECCNKSQYKEARPMEKMMLFFHLAFCRACRKFSTKNSKLTEAIQKSNLQSCTEEQKQAWREQIKKEFAEDNVQ
ncbi:hypothetical protein [Gramella sp. KN1008]|uniref:hypothetical protein n=1 Tax=Gramella sp. KN1008 TaxID=2529298 RepID=UPI001F608D59|nr:hypothetical protein [Gramella sp. KN1008]